MPFPVCLAGRFGRTERKTETLAPVSISGACSCHSGCSVVGFSSKRFSPPLTVARSHSAPSLHDHYSFPRYYGLSDSRKKKLAGLPGSSARLFLRAVFNHPGELDGCFNDVATT